MADEKTPEDPRPGRRKYASRAPGTDKAQYPARFAAPTYDALQAVASVTGASVNSVLNDAVEAYLRSPDLDAKVRAAQARQDEAIRKLRGGT